MLRDRISLDSLSEFMKYLANSSIQDGRVPPLAELSQCLGVSIASLREQMEVARALGLVEVKPKTGIRKLPYNFLSTLKQSLSYAITTSPDYFKQFSDFRKGIETAFFYEAVANLLPEDHEYLRKLVAMAQRKLSGEPIQLPNWEHRELHLVIYQRLNNPFIIGTLEAYWDLYEAVGLDVYTDIVYLQKVWFYHEKMVEAICRGEFEVAFHSLSDHMDLLHQRNKPLPRQRFE